MSTILLVEDSESLGSTLSGRLTEEGYTVIWATSVADTQQKILKQTIDLAIVDVGLPDGSGFDLARDHLKGAKVPFLFLTAMSAAEYRLEGYELGGEDYIPKPFHLKELLLRVKRVLERHGKKNRLQLKKCVLDIDSMSILFPDGRTEQLHTRDFQLLKFLIDTSPRIVSREEIMKTLWNDESSTPRTVDNSIVRIRQLLGEECGKYVRSARGVGYQWLESA